MTAAERLSPLGKPAKFTRSTGKVERIPIHHLEPNPWQPRQEIDQAELMRLRDSIRTYGFMGAIEARRNPANPEGPLQITYGHRRWQAASLANERTIPVSVVDRGDEEMALIAYMENQTQVKLTPWEEAVAFQQMRDTMGLPIRDIALYTGKSRGYVANRLDLLRLAEDSPVRLAAQAGEIDLTTANAFLNLHHVLDEAELGAIAEGIIAGRLVAKDLKSLKLALAHRAEPPVTAQGQIVHEVPLSAQAPNDAAPADPERNPATPRLASIAESGAAPAYSDRGFAEIARRAEAQEAGLAAPTSGGSGPDTTSERGPIRVIHTTFRTQTPRETALDMLRILEEFARSIEKTAARADLSELNDAERLRMKRALDRIAKQVRP